MYYGKCWTAMNKGLAVAGVAVALAAGAWCATQDQETVLHTFTGVEGGSSEDPNSGLTFNASGDLFGTTMTGGVGEFADGTVFEMTPKGAGGFALKTIHQFSQATGDGSNPSSAVVFDAKGNLYGTTPNGGNGCGIVYELSPPTATGEPWTETFLHNFDSNGDDGCNPSGRLIFDKAGDLFGVTFNGGGGASGIFETMCSNGCGTAYKLHKANGVWTQTILHHFTGEGNPDGVSPSGGVAFDKAGNLWGATAFGGAGDSSTCGDPDGGLGLCGTVFELTPNANGTVWTESTLYSFADASTGWNPFSGVILDQAGDLVGTTENGGSALQGTVFEVTPEGSGKVTESLIHQFDGEADGSFPQTGLTLGAAGSLYGVGFVGGGTAFVCTENSDGGCGIVYKLTPGSDGTWTETILYTFLGGADGAIPEDDVLAFGANGDIFGSAGAGGDFDFDKTSCADFSNVPGGCGVLFELKP
ncbi:MAG TPA: choice-of-anchor tandem repeat GloVer-containing protein [Terriglobia bacterium]|nr:choice-of-anchor tandem repeat GloVer-containing protein [Terriglobia bacterium]